MKLSEIIAAWENGETIEQQHPGSEWKEWVPYHKIQKGTHGFDWHNAGIAFSNHALRIKPRTLTINGIEFPEPVGKKLNEGDSYFLVDITEDIENSDMFTWVDDKIDNLWLSRGLIQRTKEGAKKQAEALLSLLKPKK